MPIIMIVRIDMIDIQNNTKKPNSSLDETRGIFEKYEMYKLNKYAVTATVAIINISTWMLVYKINYSWNVYADVDLLAFTSILLGVTVTLFSGVFLYFNKKINFLLDERTGKLE